MNSKHSTLKKINLPLQKRREKKAYGTENIYIEIIAKCSQIVLRYKPNKAFKKLKETQTR